MRQSIFQHATGKGPCTRCRLLWFAFALVLGALVLPTSVQGLAKTARLAAPQQQPAQSVR
jgi:hypothetical protein